MSRRCVFLDRDGVINVKMPDGQYVCRWAEFQWIESITDWIRLFNALGYLVIVVTNQRGVARGLLSQQGLDEIHEKMVFELSERGALIDDVFACPHEIGTCRCRKPLPGLVRAAATKWDIDLERSIMIGDSASDRALADACQMGFVGVRDGLIESVNSRDATMNVEDPRVR